ncbi:MAG TPA: hypothetical protein VFT82_04230 [Candidatus Paceibacterota bacterium]|nr:hypothetical protein [Candidatus Paceibacterota bacterium]
MICERGYESTGEASGTLIVRDGVGSFPQHAANSVQVVYDAEAKTFHAADDASKVVTASDYLHLSENGRAVAGWKKDSQSRPAWLK